MGINSILDSDDSGDPNYRDPVVQKKEPSVKDVHCAASSSYAQKEQEKDNQRPPVSESIVNERRDESESDSFPPKYKS